MRTCTGCGENRPEMFSKNKYSSDGLKSQCKSCDKLARKKWLETHRETNKAKSKAWREGNPNRVRQNNAKWREENIAHAKDLSRQSAARWYEQNREQAKAAFHNRRAAKAGIPGVITADQIKQLHINQEGKCVACRTELDESYHLDHIHPLSKGGTNEIENIQLLCADCNFQKNAQDFDDFLKKIHPAT